MLNNQDNAPTHAYLMSHDGSFPANSSDKSYFKMPMARHKSWHAQNNASRYTIPMSHDAPLCAPFAFDSPDESHFHKPLPPPDESYFHMPLARHKTGWIIGKKGAYIKEICEKCNCQVRISDRMHFEMGTEWCDLVVRGPTWGIMRAKKMIMLRLDFMHGTSLLGRVNVYFSMPVKAEFIGMIDHNRE